MDHQESGRSRRRFQRGMVVALTSVIAFVAGNVLAPLTARYIPLLGEALDDSLSIDPLVVNTRWPVTGGCDSGAAVAMPKGGPDVAKLRYNLEEDPRVTAVKNGAASWNSGILQISLRASGGATINVDSITVVRLTERVDPAVAWILEMDKGCGGPGSIQIAPYLLDLDRGFLVSRGEQGGLPEGDWKSAGFHGASIAADRPLDIAMEVRSCSAMREWLLKIDYSVGRRTFVRTIGSDVEPLRSIGGVADVPIYNAVPGSARPGRSIEPLDHRTPAGCRP